MANLNVEQPSPAAKLWGDDYLFGERRDRQAEQDVYGSVALAHGQATVKGFNPGFASPASFQCTASDKTVVGNAANAVPQSGSSILVRGAGEDVISYCMRGGMRAQLWPPDALVRAGRARLARDFRTD